MAAVHPLAAPRPGTRQQKPRPLAASAHAPPPSLLVDARQRGRVHSQSQERGRRGRLGGARRPWRPKTHVPLARVRNFRVREGFTSGRETYLLHQRLLTRETKSVFFLLPSARGARGCETCGLTKLLLRLGFIGSCLRAAPWQSACRGPQEQHDPQDTQVCCPPIKPTHPCLLAPRQHAHAHCTLAPSRLAQPREQRT